MANSKDVNRRGFLTESLAAAGALGVAAGAGGGNATSAAPAAPKPPAGPAPDAPDAMPLATIGNARISRLLVGGNLISGYMHCRDLKYVGQLFHAYVDDEKILETLRVAERHGVNTVFETGAQYVRRYNRECRGHMQFIPHIKVLEEQKEGDLEDHIQRQVDSGASALYVWGVSGDTLTMVGRVDRIKRAVELAKAHALPVGVGGHSHRVPVACEKARVPCDFYVKTLHRDDYPSAAPEECRKDFGWMTGGKGWYDNMWCINAEETIAFMQTVTKPWIAFKVLAAGAIHPKKAFPWAFAGGADCIAVGMFDFQIEEDARLARQAIRKARNRPRPWRA